MIETNIKKEFKNFRYVLTPLIIIVVALFLYLIINIVKKVNFKDEIILIEYIKKIGNLAPIFFVIFQIFQIVIPIIPGGISCIIGPLIFGAKLGFIYNYIGVVIGSCIAFYLSKKYGIKIIKKIFKEKPIKKYLKYIQNEKFKIIFLIIMIFPGLPDDLLCYIAGLSTMKFKTFLLMILISKPISLLMYSIFINIL